MLKVVDPARASRSKTQGRSAVGLSHRSACRWRWPWPTSHRRAGPPRRLASRRQSAQRTPPRGMAVGSDRRSSANSHTSVSNSHGHSQHSGGWRQGKRLSCTTCRPGWKGGGWTHVLPGRLVPPAPPRICAQQHPSDHELGGPSEGMEVSCLCRCWRWVRRPTGRSSAAPRPPGRSPCSPLPAHQPLMLSKQRSPKIVRLSRTDALLRAGSVPDLGPGRAVE